MNWKKKLTISSILSITFAVLACGLITVRPTGLWVIDLLTSFICGLLIGQSLSCALVLWVGKIIGFKDNKFIIEDKQ